MKKLFRYPWILTIGIIAGCNNGGSSNSDIEQLKAVQAQYKNYFYYLSDQSIKAIDLDDPANPITIEPANSSLSGYTASQIYIHPDNNPDSFFISTGLLSYAKDGQFWVVDNGIESTLTPRRVSSEDSAFNLCDAHLSAGRFPNIAPFYSYSFAGQDGVCHAEGFYQDMALNDVWLPNISDDEHKWFELNIDTNTPPLAAAPTAGARFHTLNEPYFTPLLVDSVVFYSSDVENRGSPIRGVLALDNTGSLVWFEGTDFSEPSHTVANGVSTISVLSYSSMDWYYLVIDGNLYSYSAGETSLGESIYQLQSSNFRWHGYPGNGSDYIYANDGQRLLRFSMHLPSIPVILATDAIIESSRVIISETNTQVFLYSRLPNELVVYSIELGTGSITNLFTVNTSGTNVNSLDHYFINNKIYYTDIESNSTKVVNSAGTILKSFPDKVILRHVVSPLIQPNHSSISHLILRNYYGNTIIDETHMTNMWAVSTENDEIVNYLGEAPTLDVLSGIFTPQYDGRFVIETRNSLTFDYELYFANVNQHNSLIKLTNDITTEAPIYFSWNNQ